MNSIDKVFQRMAAIEQKIGSFSNSGPTGFADVLAKTSANSKTADSGNANRSEVESLLRKTANKYNVDGNLVVAVAKAESNLDPQAVSSVGATGVMQLMPETASNLGVTDIDDVQQNIDGGVRYLKQMLNTFDGDVVKAVAAYNAGPEAVKTYNGIPPYPETRNYVNTVLGQTR